MFGFGKNKPAKPTKAERKAASMERVDHLRRGLLYYIPGGSSRLYVYLDYCLLYCIAHTKEESKVHHIDFNDITEVIYRPPTGFSNGSLQLVTKDRPNVKNSKWYAFENNMVVIHPNSAELAEQVYEFIKNPATLNIPPEQLTQLRRMRKEDKRREAEEKAAEEQARKEAEKARREAIKAGLIPDEPETPAEPPKQEKKGIFGRKKAPKEDK